MKLYRIEYATLEDLDNLIGRMKLYRSTSNTPKIKSVKATGNTYIIEYWALDALTTSSEYM